ncbi:unnamed protein product, partial [Symbiodinium sp. CCMP2456]
HDGFMASVGHPRLPGADSAPPGGLPTAAACRRDRAPPGRESRWLGGRECLHPARRGRDEVCSTGPADSQSARGDYRRIRRHAPGSRLDLGPGWRAGRAIYGAELEASGVGGEPCDRQEAEESVRRRCRHLLCGHD